MNKTIIVLAAGLAVILGSPADAHEQGLLQAVRSVPQLVHFDTGRGHGKLHRRYDRDDHHWRKYEKRRYKHWRRLARAHERWHRHNDHRHDRRYLRDHARLHRELGLHPHDFHGGYYRYY